MGCCGGKIDGRILRYSRTAKQIATGYSNLARGKKYEFTDDRVRTCQKCEKNYWLRKMLFCSICKCFIPAKARVDYEAELAKLKELLDADEITQERYDDEAAAVGDAKCPLDKWEK